MKQLLLAALLSVSFASACAQTTTQAIEGLISDTHCLGNSTSPAGVPTELPTAQCLRTNHKTFVLITSGSGAKLWTITNTSIVRGHYGQIVSVCAKVKAGTNQLHIIRIDPVAKSQPKPCQ